LWVGGSPDWAGRTASYMIFQISFCLSFDEVIATKLWEVFCDAV